MHHSNKTQHRQFPFERFASTRRFTDFDFLKKDSSWILYISDINGQFNLWRQCSIYNPDRKYYQPYQITNFIDESIRHIFSSPIDNSIIFFADKQGTENFQIYKIKDIFNSWPEKITIDEKVRYEWGAECFSHDGRYITFGSNQGDPSNMLIYIKDMESDKDDIFCITNEEGWYIPGYWSPDNKKINCSQLVTLQDYSIWVLDIESKNMEHINFKNSDKSRFIVGPWSVDGKGFYFLSDLNKEFIGFGFYNMDKTEIQWILNPTNDIELIDISSDGKMLAWTENVNGYSNLYIKNMKNGEVKDITNYIINYDDDKPIRGVIEKMKISEEGKKIGIMIDSPLSPTNIYVIDIDNNNRKNKCEKITTSLLGNLSINQLIEPQIIKYKSFDGLEISAFLYLPCNTIDWKTNQKITENNTNESTSKNDNNYRKGNNNNNNKINSKDNNKKKFGAILSVHGGPTAQERPYYDYSGLYQYLVNKEIAVIAPNYRGSTGYGKTFEKKIYHDWGGDELKDLEYAVKWLLSQEWIDKEKIGVFGASFGGFATLSCITRLPQYNWKAAVDIVGPSNLLTFVKTVPEHWKNFTEELVGNPEKEENFLKERSPITHVNNINPSTSILVIQGANDPRVVKGESDQIVETLKYKGIDIEYMIFEDEGHGFTKYNNQIKALKKSAEFIVEKLTS